MSNNWANKPYGRPVTLGELFDIFIYPEYITEGAIDTGYWPNDYSLRSTLWRVDGAYYVTQEKIP